MGQPTSPSGSVDFDSSMEEMVASCETEDLIAIKSIMLKFEGSWSDEAPKTYAIVMKHSIRQLSAVIERGNNADAKKIRDKYAKLMISKDTKKRSDFDLLEAQVDVFNEAYGKAPLPTNATQFEAKRSERVAMMRTLSNRINKLTSDYAEFNPSHPGPSWNFSLYRPPASYSGTFIHGMAPENIADPKIRAEYASSLKKRKKFMAGALVRGNTKKMQELFAYRASHLLAAWYEGQGNKEEALKLIEKITPDPVRAKNYKALIRKSQK